MATDYIPDPADVTAEFPTFTAQEYLDLLKTGHGNVTETGTVPGAASNFTVLLKDRILRNGTLTVTSGGDTLFPVPYGTAPDANEFGYGYELPLVQFDSTREGETYSILYTRAGTPIAAQRMTQIERMLQAIQAYVYPGSTGNGIDVRQYFIPGVPAMSSTKLAYSLVSQGMKFLTRLSIFANDISDLSPTTSDLTTMYLTIPGDVIDISLPVIGTDLQKRFKTLDFAPGVWPIDATGGAAPYFITCPVNAGGHANLTIEVTLQ
jgi:hypothetical protein